MLFPKKVKFRRWHTGRKHIDKLRSHKATRGTELNFGSYALKALEPARVTSRQLESARKIISKTVGKTGKYWTRIFPDRPFTRKGSEMPMGKGKGSPEGYCFQVQPGRVLFEVDNVSEDVARESLRKAGTKMPIRTKIITRGEIN